MSWMLDKARHPNSDRSLRDGSCLHMSQALYAWLPSFRPSGTKVTFGEVGAHRLSWTSYLLALVPRDFVSVLPRKEFFGCHCQPGTINPVMPEYFRLASGHSVIVRETHNFEPGMSTRLQQETSAGFTQPTVDAVFFDRNHSPGFCRCL